ncbi:hypothetical protein ACFW2Y_05755 [Streptomyces sp. NPDC058877]|uniref:hypothetical protein n=1 Tax=unclassified Streptomyces TaxID=2593676 RepID=UPI0036989169
MATVTVGTARVRYDVEGREPRCAGRHGRLGVRRLLIRGARSRPPRKDPAGRART